MNNYQKSESLFALAAVLGRQNEFNEILRIVSTNASTLVDADVATITMLNPTTQDTIKTIYKDGHESNDKHEKFVRTNVIGLVLKDKQPFFSANLSKDKRFRKNLFKTTTVKSVIAVPLLCEDIIFGCLLVMNKTSEFDKSSFNILEKLAAISAPFLHNTQKICEHFRTRLSKSSLRVKYEAFGLLGKSERFVELLQAIEAAARCDVRVLLDGKTGTGKELIARAIHQFSSRAEFPFIAIDCGAIPATLIESELFGHTRGAFTGAKTDRQGMFLHANGGTLFMDEINNLPFDMQSKLLRVLQEGEVRSIGSDKSIKTDVRIIAASSRPLKILVDSQKFREDLFFRLHVYPIYIPDLNERQEDIPLLANYFLDRYGHQQHKKAAQFHEEVIDFMKHRNWQGNIRELENFIERLVTVASPGVSTIDPGIFPVDLQQELENYRTEIKASEKSISIKKLLNKYEAELIKKALIECEWNQSRAARKLQTSEGNIRYKIKQFNIQRE